MAGNTLLSLLVKLGLESGDLDKGLGDAEKKGHTTASSIVSGMSKVGAGVAIGLAGAAAATVGFLASTIGPASDLNETVSKVGVVFGGSAKEVLAFGKTSADALGMSENSALAAAGTYGNLFRAMGMTETTSAGMSTSLVTLAGDLASFNNMNPNEVLDKLRAGLSGETEPLRSLGVNLNQAMIEQRALSDGIWDGITPITAAQKAQASYALIMEQTALAQGDFARTSDGLANQQRIMQGNFENLKSTIGAALLPMLTQLSGVLTTAFSSPEVQAGLAGIVAGLTTFSTWVIANIPTMISSFQEIATWFTNNQPIIIGVLVALGAALLAFGVASAVSAAMAMAPMLPVIAVIALIAGAVAALYIAWTTNFGGIQGKVAAVVEAVKVFWTGVQQLAAWLVSTFGPALQVIGGFLHDYIEVRWNAIVDTVKLLIGWLQTAANALGNLKLPDWLTPGSPTPFEMGLLGINDALKTVSNTGLPAMSGGLAGASEAGSGASPGMAIDYEELGRVVARAMTSALARSEFAR